MKHEKKQRNRTTGKGGDADEAPNAASQQNLRRSLEVDEN
jgi:hypothetical protein